MKELMKWSVENSFFWFVHVHRRISRENKHLELFSGFYLKRVIFIDLLNHSTFTIQNGHRRISRKNKHLDLLSGFSQRESFLFSLTHFVLPEGISTDFNGISRQTKINCVLVQTCQHFTYHVVWPCWHVC